MENSRTKLWNQILKLDNTPQQESSMVSQLHKNEEKEPEASPPLPTVDAAEELLGDDEPALPDSHLDVAPPTSLPINLPAAPSTNVPIAIKNSIIPPKKFPDNLPGELGLSLDQYANAVAVNKGGRNPRAQKINSKPLRNNIREFARSEGITLRKNDVNDIVSDLIAQAEIANNVTNVWNRVAPIPGGVEIDLGRDDELRVRITAGNVEFIREGSDVVFTRSANTLPMALPAECGDLNLLKKYLNISHQDRVLLIAWLAYTLAHAKISTTNFLILLLRGGEGSGKSLICKIINMLIDPNIIVLQIMPTNERDFAVGALSNHVQFFDNVRSFTQKIADLLCVASSGGSITSRQLYTDADQVALNLHSAIVLNGIHDFVDQPDLAQRCLTIEMLPLPKDKRRSEREILEEFERDLPAILRGLFDLIARIFEELPHVEVTNPERMFDFSKWLAAMEKVDGAPAGVYQALFSQTLKESQLDCLMDNVLASELVEFSQYLSEPWHGTPAELLAELNRNVSPGTARSRDWPQNAIALSKRLKPLQAGLLSQGIQIDFGRGKHRTITISVAR